MSSRGLPAPGSKKLKEGSKRVKKVENELKFPLFDSSSTPILTFFGPRSLAAPGTHVRLRFQLWAQRAQEVLCGD